MGYGRLGTSESPPQQTETIMPSLHRDHAPSKSPISKLNFILFFSLTLIILSSLSAALAVTLRTRASHHSITTFTRAVSQTCSLTRYPTLCSSTLLNGTGAAATGSRADLVHLSVNATLRRFGQVLYFTSAIKDLQMPPRVRSAYEDCLELLGDSVDHLSRSLARLGSTQDVLTWLSATLTNTDTCTDGLAEVNGRVKDQVYGKLSELSELVSNCLAIYTAARGSEDFAGVPIQNRRRLLGSSLKTDRGGYPKWLGRRERVLLNAPVTAIHADIVVSSDGNGTCKTILEAIKKVPDYNNRRVIIYVRAGRYDEKNLKVGRKKTNIMFVGDGKGKTIISGGTSVFDNVTTFHTASFAATGAGFIARDITFENWAGPSKHQAVALRVGADHAVVFRCNIIGYQDTLYVHSQRQFFRECDIYGTVDFIFGNAAVVFQNCSMYARKPMPNQKNTITAQNRKDPNQNTGISIHACRILATSDLLASKGSFQTYLGRPWKLYSRTIYMLSYIGDHIEPKGWLEWNATFALDTLYYGEYMNYGPGGAIGKRVTWPGYRVITSPLEAGRFTVGQFIYGSSWLPSTGVAFLAGLSV
ncbi:hypothetical protein LguiB_015256 [Lonicera macranthoides]